MRRLPSILLLFSSFYLVTGTVVVVRAQAPAMRDPGIYLALSDTPQARDEAIKLKGQRLTNPQTHGMAGSMLTMGISKPTMTADVPGSNADFRQPQSDFVFYFYFSPDAGKPPKQPDPNTMDISQMMAQMGTAMGGDVMPQDATTADNFRLITLGGAEHGRVVDLPQPGNNAKIKYAVDTTVDRLAQGIYRMKPKSRLKPGEYGIYYMGKTGQGMQLWDFGVDAK